MLHNYKISKAIKNYEQQKVYLFTWDSFDYELVIFVKGLCGKRHETMTSTERL